MTPLLFVAAARSLIGTTYHAKARLPGVGIDCIGVPIVAAWLSGAKPRTFDIQGYKMLPDGSLLPLCDEFMVRVNERDMRPSDVIVCTWGATPHHVGVLGDYRHGGFSIIHAENYRCKRVVEHRLWGGGAMKLIAAYRLPELA
jgi:hypothetical protein